MFLQNAKGGIVATVFDGWDIWANIHSFDLMGNLLLIATAWYA